MWWPFQWLVIYVLGGITFVPLVIATTIWYVMTYGSVPVGDDDPMKRAKMRWQTNYENSEASKSEGTAAEGSSNKRSFSGYLTVRRQFRSTTGGNSFFGASTTDLSGAEVKEEEILGDKDSDSGSIKEGKTPAILPPTRSATTSSTTSMTMSQRIASAYQHVAKKGPAPPKEYFFCVLKGSVLFLYEDEKQNECFAAIGIEKYHVGMEKAEWLNGREGKGSKKFDGRDSEMFGKRNSCVLRLVEKEKVNLTSGRNGGKGLPALSKVMGDLDGGATLRDKEHQEDMENAPWFFFSARNTEMEDLYLALLHVSAHKPTITDVFSFEGMKQLVNTIDTEPDPLSTRWLNAMAGRIFFSLNQTRQIEDLIIAKIHKKLAKVPLPTWLGPIIIKEVHVGKSPPILSRPMLKDLTAAGGAAMEVALTYRTNPKDLDSGVRIMASTTTKINLGLKQVTMNLDVMARVKNLEGNVLLKIKEPPSNRIWWGFTHPPKLDVEIVPVVADRKVTMESALGYLEKMLRNIVAESIVLPGMDDVAFFDTTGMDVRGGIFSTASKHHKKPVEEEIKVEAEPTVAPEQVITSAEDPSSATAETPGLRKRGPSKSQTLDTGVLSGKKSDPGMGLPRTDTAPAELSNASATGHASRKATGVDTSKRWLSTDTSDAASTKSTKSDTALDTATTSSAATTVTKAPAIARKPVSILPSAPLTQAFNPKLNLPSDTSTDRTRTPSPQRIGDIPTALSSVAGPRLSIDHTAMDYEKTVASMASITAERNAAAAAAASAGTGSIFSAVKQFREGDKKALQDMTKHGVDGFKNRWATFANKRKPTAPLPGAPASTSGTTAAGGGEAQVKKATTPYRPPEDELDAAAGMAAPSRTATGLGHGSETSRRSMDGRSLKERLDAAAAAASALGTSPTSTSSAMPIPATRSRSGTGGSSKASSSDGNGTRPTLLASPNGKTLSPSAVSSASVPDAPIWALGRPTKEPLKDEARSEKAEGSGSGSGSGASGSATPAKDPTGVKGASDRRSSQGSIGSMVSVQPGAGKSMVVPRVPRRPGEVTGLGRSPGEEMIRRISSDGTEASEKKSAHSGAGAGAKEDLSASVEISARPPILPTRKNEAGDHPAPPPVPLRAKDSDHDSGSISLPGQDSAPPVVGVASDRSEAIKDNVATISIPSSEPPALPPRHVGDLVTAPASVGAAHAISPTGLGVKEGVTTSGTDQARNDLASAMEADMPHAHIIDDSMVHENKGDLAAAIEQDEIVPPVLPSNVPTPHSSVDDTEMDTSPPHGLESDAVDVHHTSGASEPNLDDASVPFASAPADLELRHLDPDDSSHNLEFQDLEFRESTAERTPKGIHIPKSIAEDALRRLAEKDTIARKQDETSATSVNVE